MNDARRVIVVGGGWAGLATAVELTRRRIPVTLLESAKQLGGRARHAPFGERRVDNGQHLMLGAYRETLRLMRLAGVDVANSFQRCRLQLRLRTGSGEVRLSAPRLPAPLHLAWALASATGLSWSERLAALRFASRLMLMDFELTEDLSVAELLDAHEQPVRLREVLWGPLCLAILNTHPEEASARVFLRVLHDTFARRRADSDLLYHRTDLGTAFPLRALDYIERHGGSVRLGHRATRLLMRDGAIGGVAVSDAALPAAQVVLAVPPYAARALLDGLPSTTELNRQLGAMTYEPICTVYLQYPPEIALPTPMLGITHRLSQWVFDRALYGQPGLMAVVISGAGAHMAWDNTTLIDTVRRELGELFPDWPAPAESLAIREKRATFTCRPDIDRLRPGVRTPLPGCWLAGDHTDTGYPATLEGAVRSGVECAQAIARDLKSARDRTHSEDLPNEGLQARP